jgi:hypothetical protein
MQAHYQKKKKVCKLFAFWSDKSMQVEIDIWQLQKKDSFFFFFFSSIAAERFYMINNPTRSQEVTQ